MDHVRSPPELLDCLKYASCEEYCPLAIILEEFSVLVEIYALSVEVVFVVNEIYLNTFCCGNGSNLDDNRSVHIIHDNVHSRESDDLMELVLSFVDAAVARHATTEYLLPFLNALREVSSYLGDFSFRKIRIYLRIDEQHSFYRITHILEF